MDIMYDMQSQQMDKIASCAHLNKPWKLMLLSWLYPAVMVQPEKRSVMHQDAFDIHLKCWVQTFN